MKRVVILLILLLLLPFLFLSAFAEGTDLVSFNGLSEEESIDQVSLADINSSLGVIQSQLWIILVVGLLGYVYKFFRIFF